MSLGNFNHLTLFDNIERPLDLSTTDCSLWNDKCDYYEINEICNLNPSNNNLTILQLNIRSLLNKQTELNLLLNKLHQNKSLLKVLLLSETHLTESKIHHLNIPNYTLIYQNHTNKIGGGVAIAAHKSLRYKEQTDLGLLNNENFESIFLELQQNPFNL